MKKFTVALHTLGCRLNQSETASIQQAFKEDGFDITDIQESADIVIINSCTITQKGDADSRRLVNKVIRINPAVRIAIIGCQAEIQKDQLIKLPNVKWVVGTAKKMDIASIIKNSLKEDKPQIITPEISKESFTINAPSIDLKHTRANIKIQDGCNFFCSYCEVPYARGRSRSRKFPDIIREANILASAGHKELVLTGINVGTYSNEGKKVVDVIKALEQINKIERIRISSIELTTISDELLEMMSGQTKLCRYLHVPLQSANDKILKSMNRKYVYKEFKDFILKARKKVKDICIGSDVIVGFPGETDDCFQQTADRLEKLPIQYLHVFSYSKRNMARSRFLKGEVHSQAITDRSKQLRSLSNQKRQLFFESQLETTQKVLFEQKKGNYWTGLTDNFIRVKASSSKNICNQIFDVELKKIDGQTMIGSVIR